MMMLIWGHDNDDVNMIIDFFHAIATAKSKKGLMDWQSIVESNKF